MLKTSKKEKSNVYYLLGLVGQIGWAIVLPLGGFVGLGIFLDKKLNTMPLLTLSGFVIGTAVAFWSLYRLLKPFLKNSQEKKPKSTS